MFLSVRGKKNGGRTDRYNFNFEIELLLIEVQTETRGFSDDIDRKRGQQEPVRVCKL